MAGRPTKVGLDYFELDCHMEEKVRLIQAEFGLKGFAVIVKLYQKIYGGFGYYCEWSEDSLLLFMSENGLPSDSKNLIKEIVSACIRRNIFSKQLFDKFNILTSKGVQERYLNATSKRERVEMKKEYLLISVPENNKNVVINSIFDGRNSINSSGNSQSKVEKSREENISPLPPLRRFEEFSSLYPKRIRAKQIVEVAYCKLLSGDVSLTEDMLIAAAKNYAEAVKVLGTEERYIKNPQNFLKDGTYIEYLPGAYERPKAQKTKNSFNSFHQREYDYEELERKLLEGK